MVGSWGEAAKTARSRLVLGPDEGCSALVEGADQLERVGKVAVTLFGSLVSVTAERGAGGAGIFGDGLTNRGNARCNHRKGEERDNKYRDDFWFH